MMRLLALIAVIFFTGEAAAEACNCLEMNEARSKQIIEKAELIFEGTVVRMDTIEQPEENFNYNGDLPVAQNPFYAKARVKVVDLYKGSGEQTRYTAYLDTMTSCGGVYQVGDYTSFILYKKEDVLVQAPNCDKPMDSDWQDLKAGKYK